MNYEQQKYYPVSFFDEDMRWYNIRGYNGYHFCFQQGGMVRSVKNYKINPEGRILKRKGSPGNFYWHLQDGNNDTRKVTMEDIEKLIDSHNLATMNYVCPRNKVITGSRVKDETLIKESRNHSASELSFPKFTILR